MPAVKNSLNSDAPHELKEQCVIALLNSSEWLSETNSIISPLSVTGLLIFFDYNVGKGRLQMKLNNNTQELFKFSFWRMKVN